ncbi:MAG TPA: deoxyguanosinetriphosphate triphosphohydrolase [Acidobacteriaceae bacterium]|jgi:dGTPase|nr:deoxyguanosinetriphosphate triphosphohydrolase [Acidobacteriaceae bacterium]
MAATVPAACAVPETGLLAQRKFSEPHHPYRTAFQRDGGRVIHSRAFRRLAGKTQVFTERGSDHFRSRLTHTMEVAQIARTIARALGLNEDLTEALALAHDIGHPPFGHAGEKALDAAMRRYGLRFDHNLHALRIVEHFENRHLEFRGLNLTLAVREGIVKHSRDYSEQDHPELAEYFLDQRPPLEAQLIDLADEIAYLTADLDDGMEAEILTLKQIRAGVSLFERHFEPMLREHPGAPEKLLFQETLKLMLNALADDLITEVGRRVRERGVLELDDIRQAPERLAAFSTEIEQLRRQAKEFLYQNLYLCEELKCAHQQAEQVISDLFAAWMADPGLLPASYALQVEEEGAPRVIADYIAGMTDHFVLEMHQSVRKLVVPNRS